MTYDIDNLRFVFFTNENNTHLIELTLKYFFEYNNLENIKISVISNNYKDRSTLPFQDRVEYLSGDVGFCSGGGHFSESLKHTLSNIKEDYIFFFCDDYFFVSNTNFNDLKKVMNIVVNEDIDYFSFAETGCQEVVCEWKSFKPLSSPFPDDYFYFIDNDYRYLHSVQPAIWKKGSLIELVSKYNFSLHQLDETLPVIKEQNKLKCIAKSHKIATHVSTFCSLPETHFCISYCEIVRHGGFWHPKNNPSLSPDWLAVKLIDKLIQDENLLNNVAFTSLLYGWQ